MNSEEQEKLENWIEFNIRENRLGEQALFHAYLREFKNIDIIILKKEFAILLRNMAESGKIEDYELSSHFQKLIKEYESYEEDIVKIESNIHKQSIESKSLITRKNSHINESIAFYQSNEKTLKFFADAEQRFSDRMKDLDKLVSKLMKEFNEMEKKMGNLNDNQLQYRIKVVTAIKELIDKQLRHQSGSLEKLYRQMEVQHMTKNLLMAWKEVLVEMGQVFLDSAEEMANNKTLQVDFVQIFDTKLKEITGQFIRDVKDKL